MVTNNNTEISRANVTTTTEDGKVVAKFVLPIAKDTELYNAMVMMDTKGAFIADKTLAGKVYNVNKTIGAFTINESGDKVLFAPGNLQATYNGSNWTWAFAENQWDYIGNAAGNTSLTASEPFISENATVDLFGWVGASSAFDGISKFGITSSYFIGYGNVAGESMKAEWNSENLAITNGGTYAWRTLTADEWYYVFDTRRRVTVDIFFRPQGLGNVNGVNGAIILPDGWDDSVHGGFVYEGGSSRINVYSDATTPTWSQMEAAGCVFLPAAGFRYVTSVLGVGMDGRYWTSTAYPSVGTSAAYLMSINMAGDLLRIGANDRYAGFSVRLVRPVE